MQEIAQFFKSGYRMSVIGFIDKLTETHELYARFVYLPPYDVLKNLVREN